MIVERYRPEDATSWNAFVRDSRNGTFLFDRGYMDYHADRFQDHSLIVKNEEGQPLALLPGHVDETTLSSHDGLSFGGMIVAPQTTAIHFLHAFEAVLKYLQAAGIKTLNYKCVPHIYHRQSSDDDRYAFHLLGAQRTRCDVLSVVTRSDPLPYQGRRKRGIKKAEHARVTIQDDQDFSSYWGLLTETLATRHGAEPVHSLDEMRLLAERFPENIQLTTARSKEGEMLAGVVLYLSDCVTHCQYIAASEQGRELHALDLLFDMLICDASADATYFDFGSSHEEAGRFINRGLIEQKEGFGARSVVAERYRIDVATFVPGTLTGALR